MEYGVGPELRPGVLLGVLDLGVLLGYSSMPRSPRWVKVTRLGLKVIEVKVRVKALFLVEVRVEIKVSSAFKHF